MNQEIVNAARDAAEYCAANLNENNLTPTDRTNFERWQMVCLWAAEAASKPAPDAGKVLGYRIEGRFLDGPKDAWWRYCSGKTYDAESLPNAIYHARLSNSSEYRVVEMRGWMEERVLTDDETAALAALAKAAEGGV